MTDTYRPGDHWLICDRSGFRIRRSEARTEWTGEVVHKDFYEERHPQDFVRGLHDNPRARPPVRPDPIPVFGGPLTTTVAVAAAAGASSIQVALTARFADGDDIQFMLANGDAFTTLLTSVVDSTTITILPALPFAVEAGSIVINNTAVATADIG